MIKDSNLFMCGDYKCEVSLTSSKLIGSFISNAGSSNRRRLHESDTKQSTGNRKGHLTVIQDPNQNHNLTFPHIEGLKDNYTDTSHVMLTCISSSLKPAPSLAWYYKVPDSVNATGAETPVPLTSLTQFPVTVNAHGYEYSRLGIVLQFGKT